MGEIKMSDLPTPKPNFERKESQVIRMGDIPDPAYKKQREIMTNAQRKVWDVLRQGEWKGKRCFIIGGGQSVKDVDLSKLEGEKVIAVNMAYRLIDPDIIYAMDARVWGWIENEMMQEGDNVKFLQSKAVKVWSDITAAPLPEDITIAPSIHRPGVSTNLKEGVACGTNSGFGALNLALLLGASEIYLIGFDFYGERWHAGYPQGGDATMDYHLNCYEQASAQIKKEFKGQRIINVNPKSKLTCFEMGDLPADLGELNEGRNDETTEKRERGEDEPLFVSYYTVKSGYDKYAKQLMKSLEALNLEMDVQAIKGKGKWDLDTKLKPDFIQKMRQRHPGRTLVWLDADAVVNKVPELLLKSDADIAVHYRGTEGVISNCVLFADTKVANDILADWKGLCENPKNEKVWDQKLLQQAIEAHKKAKVEKLPDDYCYLVGLSNNPDVKDPVIEQQQASRKLKK